MIRKDELKLAQERLKERYKKKECGCSALISDCILPVDDIFIEKADEILNTPTFSTIERYKEIEKSVKRMPEVSEDDVMKIEELEEAMNLVDIGDDTYVTIADELPIRTMDLEEYRKLRDEVKQILKIQKKRQMLVPFAALIVLLINVGIIYLAFQLDLVLKTILLLISSSLAIWVMFFASKAYRLGTEKAEKYPVLARVAKEQLYG